MSSFHRFRKYLSRYWRWFALSVLCILLLNVAKLAMPFVLGMAVDDLRAEITEAKLLQYSVALVVIALAQGIFIFFEQLLFVHVSRSYEFRMRNDYYAHLQTLPVEFYQNHRTGDLMARAVNDMNMVRGQASYAIMYTLNTLCVVALIVPLMISINTVLTLFVFVVMPLVAFSTQGFSKHLHRRAQKVQEYVAMVANRAQESLTNMRITRAYAQESSEIERFQQISAEAVKHNIGLARLNSAYTPTLQFIVQCGTLLVLSYGGVLVVAGSISIGQFVQFMLYTTLLVYPMVELGSVLGFYERARVSMNRINEVMDAAPTPRVLEESPEGTTIDGEIEFRSLNFSYKRTSSPVLKDVNLHIKPRQMTAVLGTVGSGKSTLMNLVARVLEAEPGQLLVDGKPIQEIPLESQRAATGYVPQESFLFSATVFDNIAFGKQDATPEEVRRAAELAELAPDIEDFPKKYETFIGERGITLSGGQRQRLAIARALIRRPKILLLDDALSAVDTVTEARILENLQHTVRECTTLIVSHRVSTVRYADLIVVMEHGEIKERGTHRELLVQGGLYALLCQKQALEEELVTT
jgi:ATP-binding cassette subfamily B protein